MHSSNWMMLFRVRKNRKSTRFKVEKFQHCFHVPRKIFHLPNPFINTLKIAQKSSFQLGFCDAVSQKMLSHQNSKLGLWKVCRTKLGLLYFDSFYHCNFCWRDSQRILYIFCFLRFSLQVTEFCLKLFVVLKEFVKFPCSQWLCILIKMAPN